jgi:hypothetical protein
METNIGPFSLSPGSWETFWTSFGWLVVVTQVIWLCSVVSVARNRTKDPFDRVVWLIVVLALNIVGTFLYVNRFSPPGGSPALPGQLLSRRRRSSAGRTRGLWFKLLRHELP